MLLFQLRAFGFRVVNITCVIVPLKGYLCPGTEMKLRQLRGVLVSFGFAPLQTQLTIVSAIFKAPGSLL